MKTNLPFKKKAQNKTLMLAYGALILTTLLWGAAGPIIKLTLVHIPPFSFLFLRFLIVCIVLLPLMFIQLKRTPIDVKDIKNLTLLGIIGQVSLMAIFWGINYTSVIDAAVIGTISPLLIILAGHYFYKDEMGPFVKIGVLIATAGTAIVVLEPALAVANGGTDMLTRIFGNVLVVVSTITFMMYVVWSKMIMGEKSSELKHTLKFLHIKPMVKSYSAMLHTTFGFYVGLLMLIPFAILEKFGYFGAASFDILALEKTAVLGIIYMAIFSTIVAFIAYEWGVEHAEVSDAAIFGYLQPLFTIPIAFLLLSEVPTSVTIIGASVIAAGVFIAEKYKHPHGSHKTHKIHKS